MRKLVIFSGAGMSAESGIQTFRDGDGLWEQHRIEDVATPASWQNNPERVQRFYNQRRKSMLAAKPNLAHQLIAELEDHYDVHVITQNIDDLHERAGSSQVLHLHGDIRFAKSSAPYAPLSKYGEEILYPIQGHELDIKKDLCSRGYPLRPHVVWFGEAVPAYDEAVACLKDADLFIVIGTRLVVYPVAGLIHEIPSHCQAYYIDPEADYARVPEQYQLIQTSATVGMQQLYDSLNQP